jgi:IS30 family transposase
MGHPRLTEEYKADLWERCGRGESASAIARAVGRHPVTIAEFFREAGGIRPARPCQSGVRLSLDDREKISRGLAAAESVRAIARGLGRAPSTISREITRNGGPSRYRVLAAEQAARARATRCHLPPRWDQGVASC